MGISKSPPLYKVVTHYSPLVDALNIDQIRTVKSNAAVPSHAAPLSPNRSTRAWLDYTRLNKLSVDGKLIKTSQQKATTYAKALFNNHILEPGLLSRQPSLEYDDLLFEGFSSYPSRKNSHSSLSIVEDHSSATPASSDGLERPNTASRTAEELRPSNPLLDSNTPDANITSNVASDSATGSAQPSQPTNKGNKIILPILGGFFGLSILLIALAPYINGKNPQTSEAKE